MSAKSAKDKEKEKKDEANVRLVAQNRRARHEYEVLDTVECGIVLVGSEVKTLRSGKVMLDDAYENEELPDAKEIADIVIKRWHPAHLRSIFPGVNETPFDAASVERGRVYFNDTAKGSCFSCHGAGGKGDGPTAGDYEDDWGYPIRPRDLTAGTFRAGSEGVDLYRTIAAGIKGTPMGSFEGALKPEEIWDLVHFIQSLSRKEPLK